METFYFVVLLVHATKACFEPAATTVHIQNYDGPIYVAPAENGVTNPPSYFDKQFSNPTKLPSLCDKQFLTTKNLPSHCDKQFPSTNLLSHNNKQCSTTTDLSPACDNRYSNLYKDNQPNILHNSVPYHTTICESDCKCVSKQQSCVPIIINSVPQNYCDHFNQYPDYSGYVGLEEVCSPKLTETLNLLKTYLAQSSTKTCPQCGRKHALY